MISTFDYQTRQQKGKIVSRSRKMFKGTVVAIALMLVGYLIIDSVVFEPDRRIAIKRDTELSWDVPTEYVDSRPLAGLAGYTIHCWNSMGHRTETVVIDNPEVTSYEIDSLPPGTYQCAMSAINVGGSQSALSNVVVKTVP